MKIAVIDNFDSFVYNLVRYLKEHDHTEVVVMRNDQIDHSVIGKCDAILLSPGPGIPDEAGDLMTVVRDHHLTKPILGVCLGHQALGQFFGARLEACERPLHGKTSLIRRSGNSVLFGNLPDSFEVGRYHSWRISSDLPDVLMGTAISDSGELMALRHRELPIEGVQFHPESILTPQGRRMINNWINSLKKSKNETIN